MRGPSLNKDELAQMSLIIADGTKCRVVADLGFSPELGMYAREVVYNSGYHIVRARSEEGPWDFHKPVLVDRYTC